MTKGESQGRWKGNLETIATAAVLLASVMVIMSYFRGPERTSDSTAAITTIESSPIDVGHAPVLGSRAAKLGIVVFSDFECRFCQVFSEETLPGLRADYIDTGHVLFVFKHYPGAAHGNARRVAQLAACAGEQASFWPVHDALFEPGANLADFTEDYIGSRLKLQTEQLRECMPTAGDRTVMSDVRQGQQLRVTSTPAFFVGRLEVGRVMATRRIYGAREADIFRRALADAQ